MRGEQRVGENIFIRFFKSVKMLQVSQVENYVEGLLKKLSNHGLLYDFWKFPVFHGLKCTRNYIDFTDTFKNVQISPTWSKNILNIPRDIMTFKYFRTNFARKSKVAMTIFWIFKLFFQQGKPVKIRPSYCRSDYAILLRTYTGN